MHVVNYVSTIMYYFSLEHGCLDGGLLHINFACIYRTWIDRLSTPLDDLWFKTDFRDVGPNGLTATNDFLHEVKTEW